MESPYINAWDCTVSILSNSWKNGPAFIISGDTGIQKTWLQKGQPTIHVTAIVKASTFHTNFRHFGKKLFKKVKNTPQQN